MTQDESLARLRKLLHDGGGAPDQLAAELAAERARVAGDDAVAHELVAADLRWLRRQDERRLPGVHDAIAATERTWLELRLRALAEEAASEPHVVFDLADIRAEAIQLGLDDLAAESGLQIQERVPVVEVDDRLREEAAERVALLTAAVEDTPLDQQIVALRANSDAMAAIAKRSGDKTMRRFGRRLRNQADDRELALRLEKLFGRRGVVVFSTTNIVLLLAVLAILTVELCVELSEPLELSLQWVDALACLFFIFAFLLELCLHPRRSSYFVRHVLIDLLPAIPSAMFLLPAVDVPGVADDAVAVRALRILRIGWVARYVRALRPLVRSLRLLLFLVRGLDGLVQRFTQLLDREFVFVPAAADEHRAISEDGRRELLFAALERERELLGLLGADARGAAMVERAAKLRERMDELGTVRGGSLRVGSSRRDVPIERAIEVLWALRPQDVGRFLRQSDIKALDRVLRIVSAVPVRWLPIVRHFAVQPLPPSPEERVVALSRRVADWVERWHGRLLFHADLHGIVTGPQILDRVASALIKATQRPAVRLLLFGALFTIADLLVKSPGLSKWLGDIVALPLIILGSVCLIGLALGRWLKSLAGEAADGYRLTSEAHFLPQLELTKRRYEGEDLPFLARRVFDREEIAEEALPLLQEQIRTARAGVPVADDETADHIRFGANRVAMLYLHFLDGAPLHISDGKTTEQLLANKALENLREQFLGVTRKDKRRLRKLRLDDGTIFSGPYLWFSFITESIAVETAKRIEGYNRFCIPLAEFAAASPEQQEAMGVWLDRRADPKGGRTLANAETARTEAYPTTEFCAIDIVGGDPERDRHIATIFGDEVLDVLRRDRRTMIREIFGTRPVHHLPKHERSFNPLRFYRKRMSHGRVLLAPLLVLWRFVRFVRWLVARVTQIVREVLDPQFAMAHREAGRAPFAVALRKIHRMKAPGLREALRMRLWIDPAYCGAPTGWSEGEEDREDSDFERDFDFLHLHEREGVELRERAAEVRRSVRELHSILEWLPEFPRTEDAAHRRACELAVTCAWIADRQDVRTLYFAERWRAEALPALLERGVPGTRIGDAWRALLAAFGAQPTDRWLEGHALDLPRTARRDLRRAWAGNHEDVRRHVKAWLRLENGESPTAAAIARLRAVYAKGPAVRRDIRALRAVQSMAVLDVRNYRDLVFHLGGYEADGEDGGRWCRLP
ncbi:MAG: ion transporter [bacterium]|nr:ion transporter [bacterium]